MATCGTPDAILADNAREFLYGRFQALCRDNKIRQTFSPPYSPNFNPTERYMVIIVGGATSMMHHAGVDRHYFWSDAVQHRAALQNMIPLQGRMTTPYELQTGKKPNVLYLRVWGCEAVSYVERDHRYKFDDRAERCIYIGISLLHDVHTFKLLNLRSL